MRRMVALLAAAMLVACNGSSDSSPASEVIDADRARMHPTAAVFLEVRRLAATGDLVAASQLTDRPEAYVDRMERYRSQYGEAQFNESIRNSAKDPVFHSVRTHGEFAVLVISLSESDPSRKAASFYRMGPAGTWLEIVDPSLDLPCELTRHFYEAKGEPDARIANCP